jgi:hypothetical protein
MEDEDQDQDWHHDNVVCFMKKWLIEGIPNIHSWIKNQGGIILF